MIRGIKLGLIICIVLLVLVFLVFSVVVITLADYIAPTVEEDGVADVIEKFILSKK